MVVAQEFLLQECKNLRDLLDKTLRYKYEYAESRIFYDECSERLASLERAIGATTDADALGHEVIHLNELADLICRLERSSISEHSWPFVHELKRIASAICTEDTLAGSNTPNEIYVLADGGLHTYRIHPEDRRPSYTKKRLLTIVFPKSLKHFVLLHSILGHELGHAIWRCSKHGSEMRQQVETHIREGVFASPAATAAHIYSHSAPSKEKTFLGACDPQMQATTLFQGFADWRAWCEEILCDLVGLVIFGPSFVASECELLSSMNPAMTGFGAQHPPTAWRLNYLLDGAKILGHDARPPVSHPLRADIDAFWAHLEDFRSTDPWYSIFTEDQLRRALNGMKALLSRYPPAEYPIPTFERLEHLVPMLKRKIPPVGFRIANDGSLNCENVDFRHILFSGWITKASQPTMPVDKINQLCEHAIMQQIAVDISLAP
ncbi:MAG TPA: hypothetical protein VMA74_19515 [Dyella sp.]|uniref:hypothetical protein n=1 Tax=Dyella sp. TaxID=1869338 RepID=UPI002CE81A5D|nr:hypothetical protein [Dyella sp.]HUB91919.1 hypothetical protein [Dyella sp.]